MNERIRELAEQAGLVQGGWANADRVKIWKEDPDNPGSLKRFAELIVKECSYLADQAHKKATGGKSAGGYIREHFGVEE